jgi:uncharacterized iron-regulated protein
MKKLMFTVLFLLLSGCATNDYSLYLDTQKSLSRDYTVQEAARLNALIEMTKSNDPTIKAVGIMMLQQLQQNSKSVQVEPPKRNWFGL